MNHDEMMEAAKQEQTRLLDLMCQLGWITGYGINDATGKWGLSPTEAGAARLKVFREVREKLDYRGFPTWVALEGIAHGRLIGD